MEIPVRDNRSSPVLLASSQSGQAIVEYILVLVVTVMVILGGIYQLNTAFKSWAQGFFGDYLACLLETGELPNIDGSPGDSSICRQAFKSFSLADGKSGKTSGAGSGGGGGAPAPTGGARDAAKGGGGGGSGGGGSGRFVAGSSPRSLGAREGAKRGGSDSINTGNTAAGNYGGGYTSPYKAQNTQTKERLDNRFAFDNESADKQKRGGFGVTRAPSQDQSSASQRLQVKRHEKLKDAADSSDTGMTFGNFLRILLIAAIIIALVVLVGGQMLQVGKSME